MKTCDIVRAKGDKLIYCNNEAIAQNANGLQYCRQCAAGVPDLKPLDQPTEPKKDADADE